MNKPTLSRSPLSGLLAACLGSFLFAAASAIAQPVPTPKINEPNTAQANVPNTEAATPAKETNPIISTTTSPETPEEAEQRKQEEAAEKKRIAREAAEDKKRERLRQCQIKPVMTDAQIELCKEVWR